MPKSSAPSFRIQLEQLALGQVKEAVDLLRGELPRLKKPSPNTEKQMQKKNGLNIKKIAIYNLVS